MFTNSKPFGSGSTFGTNTFGSTSSPFGQSNTAFGAKPAGNNVFGSSAFGTSAPSTGGLFGAPTPSTGTSLFGQPSTAFGQPASTSGGSFGFGSTSSSGLFGTNTQPTQSSSLFGNTATSAFGTPRPTFGGFGSTTAGSGLFGQSTHTSTGTGLFGASSFTATPTGTTIKFNPTTGTDTMMKGGVSTNISTRHQCITCMKEYENKSLEELRMEDYAAGRKGPTHTQTGFGATGQTSLFGQPNAASTSAFSFGSTTQSKPLFGTTGTSTFGGGTNLFGQTAQPQNTSMFNKPVGFGTSTTSAGGTFNFGNITSNASTFGQNSFPKPFGQTGGGTSLFGATTTTQPSTAFGTGTFGAFGTGNQQMTGLFGNKPAAFGTTNTTTTNTFTFGTASNVSGGGLFGSKPNVSAFGTGSTGFGAPSTGLGGVFGTTQTPSTGLFGANKPATGFGTNFGSSLFSSNMTSNTTPGLFGGSTANKSLGFTFSGMGNTANTPGFGQANVGNPSLGFGSSAGFGIGSDPNAAAALMQQQLQVQQQILALGSNPFGDSPLFRNPIRENNKREEMFKPTNPAAQKALLSSNQYKVSPLPATKIKPKPIPLIPNSKKVTLFDGLDDDEFNLGTYFVPRKSVKKLTIKPKPPPHTSSLTVTSNISTTTRPNEIILSTSVLLGEPDSRDASSPQSSAVVTPNVLNSSVDDTFTAMHARSPKQQSTGLDNCLESNHTNGKDSDVCDHPTAPLHDEHFCVSDNHPAFVLTREEYYTIPTLEEVLRMIDSDGNCMVENFTIGHVKYGKVCFPGVINVAGLNLDEIVHFRPKEITIYPDDDNKPPVGEGLNRKAIITLDCVWPADKTSHAPIKDPERLTALGYKEKIQKASEKLEAVFIDYRPETGSWVFQVFHFSKYGVQDSDDECVSEDMHPPGNFPDITGKPAVPVTKVQPVFSFSKYGGQDSEEEYVSEDMQAPGNFPEITGPAVPVTKVQHVTQLCNGYGDISDSDSSKRQRTQAKKQLKMTDHDDDEMEDVSSQTFLKELDASEDGSFRSIDYQVSTHQLASALDVRSEKIQGMKASFFQHEMRDNFDSPLETKGKDFIHDISQMKIPRSSEKLVPQGFAKQRFQLSKRGPNERQIAYSSPTPVVTVPQQKEAARAYAVAREEILSSHPIIQSLKPLPQEGLPKQTSVSGVSRKLALRPFNKSLLYGKQKKFMDTSCFMGRRFRPGWSPNWTLSFLTERSLSQSVAARRPVSIYALVSHSPTSIAQQFSRINVSIGRLQLMSSSPVHGDNLMKKNLKAYLKIQLENSTVAEEDEAPIFVPKEGVRALHEQAELSRKQLNETDTAHTDYDFMKQCCNVLELCVALWGNIPHLDQQQEVSIYAKQMARREALTKWLINASKDQILSETNNSRDRKNYLNALFCHLTGKQISEACHLAQKFFDHRLALLLSQAGVNHVVKRLINKQLMSWEQSKADTFIKKERLKLYALLAGTLVWQSSDSLINCCEGLDWKRSLALHLWYQCQPCSSIQAAVVQYEDAFLGSGNQSRYSEPPYPPYIERTDILEKTMMASEETMGESETQLYDTCFYLLKLYCSRSERLDRLLMPGASTPDHLDHRLSWLLYQTLSALGYGHLSTDVASALHCNFASQLETMDMWYWAAFVLLHITDPQRRAKCVKELLLRHLPHNESEESLEQETFLHEKLKIPKQWIYEAKAIKARFLGHTADEAWFLLKAGQWNSSHNIIIRHLAPSAIINENYDYLLTYLNELSPPERSSTIMDWSSGGQVFLDYIKISQILGCVIKGEVSAYDLEKLHPEVISLCYRLSSIRCFSAKDRLCQAEMSKKTATVLRAVYTLQQARGGKEASSLYVLAPHINNLPMPEDYILQEIRAMARDYMHSVAAERLK